MYTPHIFSFLDHHLVVPPTLLDKPKFTLDTSGVVGVFGGGDEAISAMATIHVCRNRRWLGWYNSPGSFQIAKQYGRVATSGIFNGFFPGVSTDPATLSNLDGRKGPKFRAAHSGTVIEETGYLAALLVEECASLKGENVAGRKTLPIWVTIADLKRVPPLEMDLRSLSNYTLIFAGIPILASVGTCAVCGIFQDWYAFAMILLGVLANGITCLVIGGGKFTFIHPDSAEEYPAGDGILISDEGIVLLRGAEGAVNCITRGRFSLQFSSRPNYHDIGWCSVLFTIQFIAQLLLIPQASLFGQIMFVTSLTVSWIYNSRLSSLNKKIQREILPDSVLGRPGLKKYTLGTRTTMAVFVLLVLRITEPRKILDELLPNDTNVWRRWKDVIEKQLVNNDAIGSAPSDGVLEALVEGDKKLFKKLYEDAKTADDFYAKLRGANEI